MSVVPSPLASGCREGTFLSTEVFKAHVLSRVPPVNFQRQVMEIKVSTMKVNFHRVKLWRPWR